MTFRIALVVATACHVGIATVQAVSNAAEHLLDEQIALACEGGGAKPCAERLPPPAFDERIADAVSMSPPFFACFYVPLRVSSDVNPQRKPWA
jgi:hypothetical protein